MRIVLGVLVAMALLNAGNTLAQEKEPLKKFPIYKSIIGGDGKYSLKKFSEVPMVPKGIPYNSYINAQDMFIVKNEMGKIDGIYGLNEEDFSADILPKYGAENIEIQRVFFEDLVVDYLISPEKGETTKQAVTRTLNEMVVAAVEQVCGFKAKPTTFKLDAEVGLSIGLGGNIKMELTWNSEDLCK